MSEEKQEQEQPQQNIPLFELSSNGIPKFNADWDQTLLAYANHKPEDVPMLHLARHLLATQQHLQGMLKDQVVTAIRLLAKAFEVEEADIVDMIVAKKYATKKDLTARLAPPEEIAKEAANDK